MTIQTKFNPRDEVFYLDGLKLTKRKIHSLKVDVDKEGIPEIKYWFKVESKSETAGYKFEMKFENELFATKEDFLNKIETE